MSLNTYLSALASSLVLSDSEKDKITTSISTIKNRLSLYFCNIEEKKVFGSYSRTTILPRKADSSSDIDLMVVFSNPYGYKPQTFLNKLRDFVEHWYSSSEIYQSSPTIVLELHHIKFELVPAYMIGSSYYIPNGPSEWMYTDPDGLADKMLAANASNGYKLKPVIRLLKHWNIQKNYRGLSSYQLESHLTSRLQYSYISCTSYLDYVKRALTELRDIVMYPSRIDTALSHIQTAISYENMNCPYSSEQEIKKVFPEV